MKARIVLVLIYVAWLSACSPQAASTPPGTNLPVRGTLDTLALTKAAIQTADVLQHTQNSPKNGATWTAIMAAKFAGRTQPAVGVVTDQAGARLSGSFRCS